MRRWLGILMAILMVMAVVTTALAQDTMNPRKPNFGSVGKATHPYAYGYFYNIWLGTGLIFEGTTANDYETTIIVTDPTADRTITFPNASGTVVLTSIAEVANAVWLDTNAIKFEGATANDFETSIVPVDPTADRTITLPNESGTVVLSSLATNAAGVANSVTMGTNQLIFEGATGADGFQTFVTPTDATADRTITLPDATGTVALTANKLSDFAATSSAELAGIISNETGSGALVFATSPALVTPALGAATSTSVAVGASGTVLTQIRAYAESLTPAASSAAIQTAEQTFTVNGLATTDKVIVNGPAPTSLCPPVTFRVSDANTLAIGFTTLTAAGCTPAAGTYNIIAIRN